MKRNLVSSVRRTRLASRVVPIESLEQRQHFSAGGFSAKIDFQPSGASTPAGYTADTGLSFRSQGHFQFGWNIDNRSQSRDRNAIGDQRLDTLTHLARSGGASRWEIAVPSGNYTVAVHAGDPVYLDSNYKINVEGVLTVSGAPTANNRFIDGTSTVNVTDGRLTITSASGGVNNKLSFVDISSTTATPTSPNQPALPAQPAGLTYTTIDSDSVRLVWNDTSSNEQGFIIEQSQSGGAFQEIGRNATNDNDRTLDNLASSTNYQFRIRAYNDAGTSISSSPVSLTTQAAPTNPTPTNPPPNPNQTSAATRQFVLGGVNANIDSNAPSLYNSALRDLNISKIRVWYKINSWNEQPNTWFLNRAAQFKALGYTVMLNVWTDQPTSYSTARSYMQRLVNAPGAKANVDYWQFGNEPNLSGFWRGTLPQYVNTFLKPAYEVFAPAGETVVGAGASWDVSAAQQLVAAGYNNYCHFAAFHPYARDAGALLDRVRGAKAAFGSKPLILTEWNLNDVGNTSSWANQLNTIVAQLPSLVHSSYYFGLVYTGERFTGPAHLLNTNRTPRATFYSMFDSWIPD